MEASQFIARLLGILYLAVGIGMCVSPDFYKRMFDEFGKSVVGTYLGSALALVAGFLIVSFHNRWEADWTVVITVIGWMALLKGVALLIAPEMLLKPLAAQKANWFPLARIVALVLGAFFCGFGFFG